MPSEPGGTEGLGYAYSKSQQGAETRPIATGQFGSYFIRVKDPETRKLIIALVEAAARGGNNMPYLVKDDTNQLQHALILKILSMRRRSVKTG